MPGPQMPGYEADVIGGGMDGDSEQSMDAEIIAP